MRISRQVENTFPKTHLEHERMRRMNKVGNISFRCRLQAQLTVRRHRIVHEHNGIGKLTIVQHLQQLLIRKERTL